MRTIVFASGKGGVGKTTLSFNCAIEAARTGATVDIVDLDPTEALTRFCKMRKEDGALAPDNPMLLKDVRSVTRAVAQLNRTGMARDVLIVDTPNALASVIEDAIAAADVIVMPVQPSPVDVLVNEQVVDLVARHGKLPKTIFVVNLVDNRSSIGTETATVLAPLSPNPPVRISALTDFKRALIQGQGAVEINQQAAREIRALWAAIVKVANRDDHETAHNGPARHNGRPGVRV